MGVKYRPRAGASNAGCLYTRGRERVVVVWHVTGTAKASGVPTELRLAVVYTIRAEGSFGGGST